MSVSRETTCQEDQPCWNWATMGNQDHGPGGGDDALCTQAGGILGQASGATGIQLTTCSTPVAMVVGRPHLPATGAASMPLVGTASVSLVLGIAICRIFRRKAVI